MFVRLANTEHFHYVLDKAIHRLEGHCNYWEVYLEDNADNTCCTESDKCEIRNALGILLISNNIREGRSYL